MGLSHRENKREHKLEGNGSGEYWGGYTGESFATTSRNTLDPGHGDCVLSMFWAGSIHLYSLPECRCGTISRARPAFLDELVALASTARPESALDDRLNTLLNTPFVQSDTAGHKTFSPIAPTRTVLGPFFAWAFGTSKEASISNEIRSALSDPGAFLRMTRTDNHLILAKGKLSNRSLPR